ncbi:MAG: amidohydrolase [Gemmatimonadetes bacterium]|nr:amidohydrolase [Gemmatimonadota bacterium]NIO31460.1 amidohydrolase [Gemmatimonadota bacterium]
MGRTCRTLSTGTLILLILTWSVTTAYAQRGTLMEQIERRLENVREDLVEIRRDIHSHPEVSGQEERTAGVVAARLRALGLEVQTGVGGHGVVGVLQGARPSPTVAYRADMDAVYSNAPDPVAFASQTPGARHICGHDIHTTVALGVAEALTAIRDELPGTVKFIFQPAEENIQGALAMIEDGVLKDPVPQAIFAFHSAPLEVGQIGSVEGPALPGLDRVTVTLRGAGDLSGAARDYARAISAVSTGDAVAPTDYVLAMIGGPQADPERGASVITGMVRAGSPEARTRARQSITEQLAALSHDGVSYELDYEEQVLPDMVNEPKLVRSTLPAIRSVVGPEELLEINQITPYFGEDFAYFQQRIPGAMYWLGVSNSAAGTAGTPHSPDFVADEESIFVGAKVMAAVLLDYLERH